MSDQGEKTCPLCAEEMDFTDQQLKPCKCGYEVWIFLMITQVKVFNISLLLNGCLVFFLGPIFKFLFACVECVWCLAKIRVAVVY